MKFDLGHGLIVQKMKFLTGNPDISHIQYRKSGAPLGHDFGTQIVCTILISVCIGESGKPCTLFLYFTVALDTRTKFE